MKVFVVQSCPTLCGPMFCSLPDSSVHGILQARILEWGAIPFSRESSWPRDWTQVSCIVGRFFARYLSHQRSSYILLTLVISTLTKWLVSFILSSKFCPLRLLLFPTNSFLGAHTNRWDALKIALLEASIGQQKRPNVSLWQSKVEQIGQQSFASSTIFTSPLATNYHFFKHLNNFFQGKCFHN